MADHDDDVSPWERDDWTSSEGPSFEALTAPVDPDVDTAVDDQLSSRRPHGARVWIAAFVGVVLLIGGVVALVTAEPEVADTVNTVPESGGGVPAFWNDDPAETTDPAADERLAMATSSVGEGPLWNTWSLDVPAPLDAMTKATEVVAFGADGILYRIAFPSGQVQAMRMEGWDSDAQAVVGEKAIVVFTNTELWIARDDEPIVSVPMRGGVIFVEAWPGTNQFIVTTESAAPAGGEQQLILGLDGTLAALDSASLDGSVFWARSFLPDGRVAVNRPGGVYAVVIDQPATRLSDGDLLGMGAAHYAVVECDEALRCATFVIDAATGERTEAMLDALGEAGGSADPSTRISPDGRTIVFADRSTGTRRLLDAATGVTLDVGDVDEVFHPNGWASDSSGVFSEEGGSIVFHQRDSGGRIEIDEVDAIASVATRQPLVLVVT
ncbi:MAG TPA: hypothetical protein VES40_02570 [Ilumatobacteraceae bacterium]|nr:hypothetical protein [Ilumatobacteraceae bacterium]